MEAIKFCEEAQRYCNAVMKEFGDDDCCCYCEIYSCCANGGTAIGDIVIAEYKSAIDFIKKWGMDNPIKTRQSEFLKLFPNATIMQVGCLSIAPCSMDKKLYRVNCTNCKYLNCSGTCNKSKYWSEEIE